MAKEYEIVVTEKASKNLELIVLYVKEEVSLRTADKIRLSLLDAISKLNEYPKSNGILHEISDKKTIYRRVIKWSYRVIYHIDEEQKLIYVMDVDHVKRNPNKLKENFI